MPAARRRAAPLDFDNRFTIRFLSHAADSGVDPAGNPRYAVPLRVRQVILRLAAAEDEG